MVSGKPSLNKSILVRRRCPRLSETWRLTFLGWPDGYEENFLPLWYFLYAFNNVAQVPQLLPPMVPMAALRWCLLPWHPRVLLELFRVPLRLWSRLKPRNMASAGSVHLIHMLLRITRFSITVLFVIMQLTPLLDVLL
jgi:hypothetical protein